MKMGFSTSVISTTVLLLAIVSGTTSTTQTAMAGQGQLRTLAFAVAKDHMSGKHSILKKSRSAGNAFQKPLSRPLHQQQHQTSLYYNNKDDIDDFDDISNINRRRTKQEVEEASPLKLSTEDLKRFSELKSRQKTLPLMIFDSVLPKQKIVFQSDNPKFYRLLEYVLKGPREIGMIGFNPHTGRPLNLGVTLSVTEENISINGHDNVITLTLEGEKRFEIQGEPWLDDSGSFHLTNVEIIDNREEYITEEETKIAKELSKKLPNLVDNWLSLVIEKKFNNNEKEILKMANMGPMPDDIKDRALWVAALVNPSSANPPEEKMGPQNDEQFHFLNDRVCLEIRPAMLSCRNNHDRMILANAALQSSIDHLSGKRKLF